MDRQLDRQTDRWIGSGNKKIPWIKFSSTKIHQQQQSQPILHLIILAQLSSLLHLVSYSIIILACLLHPYFNLHFTPLSSFLRRTSCSLMILSPSYILLHNHPYTIIILTLLSSLLHYHPYSIIILTPLSSLLHYHPYSIIILTPLSIQYHSYTVLCFISNFLFKNYSAQDIKTSFVSKKHKMKK